LDALLALCIAYLVGTHFWFVAVAIFIFLTFWPGIYAARGALYSFLIGLFGRRDQIEEFKREFTKVELPNVDSTFADLDYYLSEVMESKKSSEGQSSTRVASRPCWR
jgi:hypothetical protein